MRIDVLFAGHAGQGVNTAAELLAKCLADYGYYVFNYRDYGSYIKGAPNFNIVSISDKPIASHAWTFDIGVFFHKEMFKLKELAKKDAIIVDLTNQQDYINVVGVGHVLRLLGVPLEILAKKLEVEFGKLGKEEARFVRECCREVEARLKLKRRKKKSYITGSEAIAKAFEQHLDMYIAYPMTPATPVLHLLAKRMPVFQPENEIAAINMALGASYAGLRVAVGTSGGGYDLMAEAISLHGMSEIPLVIYLAQRAGPSTGVPTYTEQGDMLDALFAGHGEFPRIVAAPGDASEAYEIAQQLVYLAYKYNTLAILLGDKHLAESGFTLEGMPRKMKIPNFLVKAKGMHKSYALTKNGVSPRSIPGYAIVKMTSYEHDEYGFTTEDAEMIAKMKEKRLRKAKTIEEAVKRFETYATYGRGKKVIVSWGSTKGAILDALPKGWKFVQIKYLRPFPREVTKILKNAEKIVCVENNSIGQLAYLLKAETGVEVDAKILKYDGRPFTASEVEEALKNA